MEEDEFIAAMKALGYDRVTIAGSIVGGRPATGVEGYKGDNVRRFAYVLPAMRAFPFILADAE